MGSQQNISSLKSSPILILLGPQGSGKGTQARFLVKKYHLQYLATGDIFREIAKKNTPLGKQIANYLNAGNLIPNDIMMAIFEKKLKSIDIPHGILFDGMPRTLNQAQLLDKMLSELNHPLPMVIYLRIKRQTAIDRSIKRRICINCNNTYLPGEPSYTRGICDNCGGKVISRSDDTPKVIANRLDQYYTETEPVTDYYRRNHRLIEIDGEPPVGEVTQKIITHLEQL